MLKNIFISLRPAQWTKNLLIFAGIIFSQNISNFDLLFKVIIGFFSFSFLSGAVYLLNDVHDSEEDKNHPVKARRPVASGQLKKSVAVSTSIILIGISVFTGFVLHTNFGLISVVYFALMFFYTFILKYIVIVDVIVISLGFLIRALAGALLIDVMISKWLIICTIFLTLLLALCKRRGEIINMSDASVSTRKVLFEYSIDFLNQLITITTAAALIAYTLYTTDIEVIEKFGTRNLIFSVPFVLYGIFRYLYLIYIKNSGENPEYIFLKDVPMIINFLLYVISVYIIIY